MKLALDAMGGDFAPGATVEGVALALKDFGRDLDCLYLVGDESSVRSEMDRIALSDPKIELVHASEVVTMHDSAVKSVRQKKDSSISRALDLVKKGEADGAISAGNTGAMVAASTIKLRTLEGVERAGIASPVPNDHGLCNLLDAGANVEAKPKHLLGYAIMGSVYSSFVQGKENPRIGLLSVGEEDSKGTDLTRETFALLKEAPINFIGNVEGYDLFQGPVDVIVCDGFTGNVMLKTAEGTVRAVFSWLKQDLTASPITKLGAWIAKKGFSACKDRGNPEHVGGSPLLGVKGSCIIAHGGSTPRAISNAIRAGCESVKSGVNPHIEEEIARCSDLMA
ncbi:MAG: phosphate acyltransferase PlsX [Verrucomicrobiota bacterium]